MTEDEKKLLQAKHRLEEAQMRRKILKNFVQNNFDQKFFALLSHTDYCFV